jgi:t-SNARE complex subunit (syntaxin)
VLPYHDESTKAVRAARIYRWRLFVAGLISVVLAVLVAFAIVILSQ